MASVMATVKFHGTCPRCHFISRTYYETKQCPRCAEAMRCGDCGEIAESLNREGQCSACFFATMADVMPWWEAQALRFEPVKLHAG